jgi:bifunctional UDP-N-acetylglucosamine pyrophosphorylase/glucosamine-1-phosphate N-acetyltransferase
MSSPSLSVVVLAAGLGTRMKSSRAKVLHRVCGRPMIEYPLSLARSLGARRVIAVLGHQLEAVRAAIDARFGKGAVEVALQAEQRGTGHALMQAAPLLANDDGLCLVLSGDVPLMTEATLRMLVASAGDRATSLLTFVPPSPRGYGRIVRDEAQRFAKIVEERDATDAQRRIAEVNAGIYCGPTRFLVNALSSLQPNNAQGELYLTDVLAAAATQMDVHTIECATEEVMGVNDRVDLSRADRVMRLRIAERHQRAGVTIFVPESVTIEPDVELGQDVELGAGVELRGRTSIGAGTRLDTGVIVVDTRVGNDVHIKPYCVLTDSVVGDRNIIGPWAHLRPGTELADEVHLGNFVETKKTRIGRGSKANHLTYLGDADVGAGVNVGCGTITCNYDGFVKYKTIIGDRVFVGSDTQLVAPVRVGDGAVIGAGTTVYEDVPPDSLALTRTRQIAVPGWAAWKRASVEAAKLGAPLPPRPARPAPPRAIGDAPAHKTTTKTTTKRRAPAKKKPATKRAKTKTRRR